MISSPLLRRRVSGTAHAGQASVPPHPPAPRSQYQEVLGGFITAFPDLKVEVHDAFSVGDRVAARWAFSGNHTGALGELPATNQPVNVDAMIITRLDGGKMAESWVVYDCMGMMQQLGVVPAP